MLDDTSRERAASRRVSSLEAAGVKATLSPTVRKKAPVLPSPISTARTGRSHTSSVKTPNSATSPATTPRLAKTPPLKSRLTPSNSKDTTALRKKMYSSTATARSSSRLSNHSSTSSIRLTPTTSKSSHQSGTIGTASTKRSLIVDELKVKYQEAQATILAKDDSLKQQETDLKDLRTKLEHVQRQLEQQISADQSRTDEQLLMEQLREQQQQLIHLKQLHENEKSDILLHQQESEKRNRQHFESLREKLEIEKNALNDTMTEKEKLIDKLNHELDEMRDNIQVGEKELLGWRARLTVVSNQLETRYEQRIHSLLEQIKASEPQKKLVEDMKETQRAREFELENQIKQLTETHKAAIQDIESELHAKDQALLQRNTDIKALQDHQITVETALETEKLKYRNLVTSYDDLAKKKGHEYSDLQHEMSELLLENNELRKKVLEYESTEESHLEEIKRLGVINSTNTSELRSIMKYQQLQEEQIQKEIDIAKHDLDEEFKQQLSLQKAAYVKETSQFQDRIDKLQFELNVCNDKLNQSKEDQDKKSIENETFAYKRDCDLHGGNDSEFKICKRLVHQHQKELNVLQEQFQSILNAKDDQISDLVYRAQKGQHRNDQPETLNADADDMNNEVQSSIYLNYTM
ncbi:hypothetical protein MBANPS3_003303 [Mucor bainieri]